jgi:Peptidase inhibitor I78 family
VLAAMTFPSPTRIIEPGMAVTMDYSPERLNIWLAEGRVMAEVNVIERVTCG